MYLNSVLEEFLVYNEIKPNGFYILLFIWGEHHDWVVGRNVAMCEVSDSIPRVASKFFFLG